MERRKLGRTGLEVGRLGISAGYGVPTAAVERSFERGVNYLYWGSRRTSAFAQALRNLRQHRERMVLVLQSYSRVASLVAWGLERALKSIHYDYADLLLLGLWNKAVPSRILDASMRARERGLVRHIAISTHHRPLIQQLAADREIGVVHLRYNAVHSGAEREVFPLLPSDESSAGIVAFTATSWRQLLKGTNLPDGDRVPTAGDCYRFVLSQPRVDVCMTGPNTAAHAEEALRAAELGPMSEDDLARMRRVGSAIYAK